jgi:hypothetical protein
METGGLGATTRKTRPLKPNPFANLPANAAIRALHKGFDGLIGPIEKSTLVTIASWPAAKTLF